MLGRLIAIVTLIRLKWCAGEQKVTELHSDHTATILPAGDATESSSYKHYVLNVRVRVCKTVFGQVPRMFFHGNNHGHLFFNILISLGKGRTD